MNFDGEAFVRNISSNFFASDNDHAFVRDIEEQSINNLCSTKGYSNALVIHKDDAIPYTVQVYGEEYNIQELVNSRVKVYISSIQPTNVKYNPKTIIVYDSESKESALTFSGTSVNVISKAEVVIPETSNYSDMSLVIQKNSFVEIKVPENVSAIINLPEELTHITGYIKGTFTKSGEYNIKIKYPDGEQILNIVVPYYQRLL